MFYSFEYVEPFVANNLTPFYSLVYFALFVANHLPQKLQ